MDTDAVANGLKTVNEIQPHALEVMLLKQQERNKGNNTGS
nr:hypothetical protein [Peribacillus frigoritolerans]